MPTHLGENFDQSRSPALEFLTRTPANVQICPPGGINNRLGDAFLPPTL
jgi:hypothetical protein